MATTVTAGTPVTLLYPQDAYPYVIIRVSPSGKTAWMVEVGEVDQTTGHKPARFDGPFPVWDHTYTDAEVKAMRTDRPEIRIYQRADGTWRVSGRANRVEIGQARYYRNYSL